MPANEQRTMEIVATVRDLATRQITRIGRVFSTTIRTAFIAPIRGLQGILSGTTRFLSRFGQAAIGVFAALRSVQAFGSIFEDADNLRRFAAATSSTVEQISRLRGAFQLAGLDANSFESQIETLNSAIAAALRDREGREFEAFNRLGISTEDLRRLDLEEILARIARGLQQFGTQAEQTAQIEAIFTEDFLRIVPLLGRGEEGFRSLTEAAERFGATISGNLASAASRALLSLREIGLFVSSAFRDAVFQVAEQFQPLVDQLTDFLANNREAFGEAVQSVIRTFISLLAQAAGAFLLLVAALQDFETTFSRIIQNLRTSFFGNQIANLANALGFEELDDKALEARNALDLVAEQVVKLQGQAGKNPEILADTLSVLRADAEAVRDAIGEGAPSADALIQQALDRARQRGLARQLLASGNFAGLGQPSAPDNADPNNQNRPVAPDSTPFQDFFTDVREGLKNVDQAWGQFRDRTVRATQDIVQFGTQALSNSISSVILGTQSLGDAFRNLGKVVVEQLVNIITEMIVIATLQRIISPIIGGGNGGGAAPATGRGLRYGGVVEGQRLTGNSSVPFRAFRDGGVATGPTLALFGEGGGTGEAFVPLNGNRRIPVELAGGAGSTTVYQFNISAVDGASVKRMLIQERDTVMGLFQSQLPRDRHYRSTVKRASR
jgi:hypothetical protein